MNLEGFQYFSVIQENWEGPLHRQKQLLPGAALTKACQCQWKTSTGPHGQEAQKRPSLITPVIQWCPALQTTVKKPKLHDL